MRTAQSKTAPLLCYKYTSRSVYFVTFVYSHCVLVGRMQYSIAVLYNYIIEYLTHGAVESSWLLVLCLTAGPWHPCPPFVSIFSPFFILYNFLPPSRQSCSSLAYLLVSYPIEYSSLNTTCITANIYSTYTVQYTYNIHRGVQH
jgi:hypothetical protein